MTEQFEQAKREFAIKTGHGSWNETTKQTDVSPLFLTYLTSLLEQHKEVILREELIKFGKTLRGWGIELPSDILACAADEHIEYLKNVKK